MIITINDDSPTVITQSTVDLGLPEAPQDGKLYGRKDDGWEEITTTPGTFTLYSHPFDNADLVDNVLTLDHGLGRLPVSEPVIYTPAGVIVGADISCTTTQIIVDFKGAITGTPWTIQAA